MNFKIIYWKILVNTLFMNGNVYIKNSNEWHGF